MTKMSDDDASVASTISSQSSATSIVGSSDDDLSFAEDLCVASIALSFRAGRLQVQRINWILHCQLLLHENLFHIKYRMSLRLSISYSICLN